MGRLGGGFSGAGSAAGAWCDQDRMTLNCTGLRTGEYQAGAAVAGVVRMTRVECMVRVVRVVRVVPSRRAALTTTMEHCGGQNHGNAPSWWLRRGPAGPAGAGGGSAGAGGGPVVRGWKLRRPLPPGPAALENSRLAPSRRATSHAIALVSDGLELGLGVVAGA